MSDNKNNFFQKWFKESDDGEKTKKRLTPKLVLILLALGILLMFSSDLFQKKQTIPVAGQNTSNNDPQKDAEVFAQKDNNLSDIEKYEKNLEAQLKDALDGIDGVSDVTVVVNLASSETKVLEKDTVSRNQKTEETDQNGGKRSVDDQSTDSKTVIIRNGDKETPIITKVKKPEVRGVMITAKGADNIEIKKNILEAVTRLLEVPSHRVSILSKKD